MHVVIVKSLTSAAAIHALGQRCIGLKKKKSNNTFSFKTIPFHFGSLLYKNTTYM